MAVALSALPRFPCTRQHLLQLPSLPCTMKCAPLRPQQRFCGRRWVWFFSSQRSLAFRNLSAEGSFQGGNINEVNRVDKEPDLSMSSSASTESHKNGPGKGRKNEIMEKLKKYGIAGVLSYGLLNTAYYLTTFLVVWFYVAPAPARLGYANAVERFIKIMAMVWAGSQVTKLIRAGGALALAPIVDNGLSWFTVKFKFESKAKAFAATVGFCFGLAVLLFIVLTLLWA